MAQSDEKELDKRKSNPGRRTGRRNYKVYKWLVTIYSKDTYQVRQGKFCSISHINEEWDLKLTNDIVHRIQTRYRADLSMRNGKNSFLQRWGHIKLEKIHEPADLGKDIKVQQQKYDDDEVKT